MSDTSPAPVLAIRKLGLSHPGEPAIVADWSATLGPGLALLHGDTGSGKTSLLRVLAGAAPAQAGDLTLVGVPLAEDSAGYRRQVYFVDPGAAALDSMDLESATHALVEADPRFRRAGWNALVDGFDLLPHRLKPLHTLSTGSRRKVGLAAALACGRPLILLDEPGAALDSSSARHLWRALEALARRGDQLVVVASADRSLPLDWTNVIELPRR